MIMLLGNLAFNAIVTKRKIHSYTNFREIKCTHSFFLKKVENNTHCRISFCFISIQKKLTYCKQASLQRQAFIQKMAREFVLK